jgi:hypothetical protein
VGIPADLAQRDRVNQVEVSSHQLGEGGLRPVAGVTTKQFGVFQHVLPIGSRPRQERTKKGRPSAALENALADAFVHFVPLLLGIAAGIFLERLLAGELHDDRVRALALGLHGLGPNAGDALELRRQLVRAVEGGLDLLWRGAFLPRNRDHVDEGLRRGGGALRRGVLLLAFLRLALSGEGDGAERENSNGNEGQ